MLKSYVLVILFLGILLNCAYSSNDVNLYVDADKGDDKNDGLSESTPFKTIQAAATKATPGTTIHIADGIYRETVSTKTGEKDAFIRYVGTGNNVIMSGSVPASKFSWKKESKNIWVADVSSDFYAPPTFVTYRNSNGKFIRCHQARTPNYKVENSWNYTEFWGIGKGGKDYVGCYGEARCDDTADADFFQLTDDAFKTMDDLVGARIFVGDRIETQMYYNRTIVEHDKTKGTIKVDKKADFYNRGGLGMYSVYFVYGKKNMIDEEGEYAFEDGKLYIKWSEDKLPDSMEFSKLGRAFLLTNKNYLKFENIIFMHYEASAILESGNWGKSVNTCSFVYIENCSFNYNREGVRVSQSAAYADGTVHDWYINNCSFTHCDSYGLFVWTNAALYFPNVGIVNFWVTNCYFYHLGFFHQNNDGIRFDFVKGFYFLNNTVKYIARAGLCVNSVAHKDGLTTTGNILIRGNLFDQTNIASADYGVISFWSELWENENQTNVWKDVLVMENVFQNTFGFSRAAHFRKKAFGRDRCDSYAGGLYTESTTGVIFYRNIFYNVKYDAIAFAEGLWEVGTQTLLINNLMVNSRVGINMGSAYRDQTAFITIKNNVIVDAAAFGIQFSRLNYPTPYDKFDINNNLYYRVGWDETEKSSGLMYVIDSNGYFPLHTFDDIHGHTRKWETTNYSFDPQYKEYKSVYGMDKDDRFFLDYFDDGTFDVTQALVDKGSSSLPDVLQDLLSHFGIKDSKTGNNYDLGPYESGCPSWLPSSKKNPDRDESDIEGGHSLHSSMSMVLCCFLFFVFIF